MNDLIKLDLLIPTYNRALLLYKCIESVIRADRPQNLRVTVVVIDNDSSDDTKSVVDSFAHHRDLCLRYVSVLQRGKSAALNQALSLTDSELVGMIDDDEEIDATWFQVIYREFSTDSQLDYIGGSCVPNWEQVQPDWFPRKYVGAVGIAIRLDRVEFSRGFKGLLMGGNAVIRRTTLERVLPYPEHLGKIGRKIRSGEDEVIHHRLLRIAARGVVVPDLVVRHWIPARRLTKKYFRRWTVGRGISVGSQLRDRGFGEPSMFGIPRYMFGAAVRGLSRLSSRLPEESFTAQLSILDCFATLYGRFFYKCADPLRLQIKGRKEAAGCLVNLRRPVGLDEQPGGNPNFNKTA